jgi:hypothetical protein
MSLATAGLPTPPTSIAIATAQPPAIPVPISSSAPTLFRFSKSSHSEMCVLHISYQLYSHFCGFDRNLFGQEYCKTHKKPTWEEVEAAYNRLTVEGKGVSQEIPIECVIIYMYCRYGSRHGRPRSAPKSYATLRRLEGSRGWAGVE